MTLFYDMDLLIVAVLAGMPSFITLYNIFPGLIKHRGNEGDSAHQLTVEINNFLIRVPITKVKIPWCPCPFKNVA